MTTKRLFFGFKVDAPWPSSLPHGRIVPEDSRHLTVAFLGNCNYEELQDKMPTIPLPDIPIGKTGYFNHCLFLPEKHPHVVAWHGQWFEENPIINNYYHELAQWLAIDARKDWLCHSTVARSPFQSKEWLKAFQPMPFMITNLSLYESLPGMHYQQLWSKPFVLPFEEVEHTADIAFLVRGKTVQQIYWNAFTALSWRFPTLLAYKREPEVQNLDDVIIALNACIGLADEEHGCPYKAISFHGDLKQKMDFLEWEMIVDV